jgi:hypothetical protein
MFQQRLMDKELDPANHRRIAGAKKVILRAVS